MTDFVSIIFQIIMDFYGSSDFYSSIMLAPFIFYAVRQVIAMFRMIAGSISGLDRYD